MSTSNGRGGRRRLTFLASAIVSLVVLGALASFWTLGEGTVEGTVLDGLTAQPLANARVVAAGQSVITDENGRFSISGSGIRPGVSLQFERDGYRPADVTVGYDGQLRATLEPYVLTGIVLDAASGQPLPGATVLIGEHSLTTETGGRFSFVALTPGAEVTVEAPGYATTRFAFDPNSTPSLALVSKPVADATVSAATSTATTDDTGWSENNNVPLDATITVRKGGYLPTHVAVGQQNQTQVTVQPDAVRALYLTYYGVGSDEILSNALELIQQTEANALVIDIKGDRGWLAYPSKVPMVAQVGAQQEIMIPDPRKFVQEMHDQNIYLIARVVTFKDNPLATAHPEWAVHDTVTGSLWIDNEGLAWTDAFHEEVWDYNIAIAREAAELGFDEVQFDYVRFPTDASANTSVDRIGLAEENLRANRVRAISGFLQKASTELKPYGVLVSADVFGYVCWRADDMGIGQHLETLGQVVDVIAPMVYPTLYWDGIPVAEGPAFENDAPAHPYEIVQQSLKIANARLKASGARAVLRPWLQYYNDYVLDIPYGDREIRAQKQATYDNGINGWMLWDPSNNYAKGGFEPKN